MTADPHCASAEMMSVLAALYPGHRLVDGTFPQLALSFRNGAGIALDLGGPEGAAQAFYGRFRQRGGHAPVLSPGGLLAFLRAEDTSAATVFAAPPEGLETLLAAAAPGLREGDVALVPDAGSVPDHAPTLARAGFAGGLRLTFRRPQAAQTYVLATRRGLDEATFAGVLAALREVAVDIGGGANAGGWRELNVDLPAEGYRPPLEVLPPRRFVHDGARRSEGDADYSWLWIGEERRVRVLLGCVPAHFRRLRLVVPNARPEGNLAGARVFLNGEATATQSQIWAPGSGAIDVELAPRTEELVVTLAAPQAEGGLSICLDKIELCE